MILQLLGYNHPYLTNKPYIDGLMQDCSISSALAMEILQSCTKPSIFGMIKMSWLGKIEHYWKHHVFDMTYSKGYRDIRHNFEFQFWSNKWDGNFYPLSAATL